MKEAAGRRASDISLVELILTTACNLKCSYCYQNARSERRMEWDVLRAALDRLLRSRRRELRITLYGGEPLLEMALIRRAVGYVRRRRPAGKRIAWLVLTNGTRLDPEAAAFLARHRIAIQVSHDGGPAAQAARGRGTFHVVDRLRDRLQEDHPAFFFRKVSVNMTLTAAAVPHLAAAVRYFLKKGVAEIHLTPLLTHDPAWRPAFRAELEDQLRAVHRDCLRHYRRTGGMPFVPFKGAVAEPVGRRGHEDADDAAAAVCRAGRGDKITVGPNGQVTSCVFLAGDYQRFPSAWLRKRLAPLALGDVRDRLLGRRLAGVPAAARAAGLFHHPEKRYSSYGRCGECPHLAECSVCPVSIGHIPGNRDPRRVPDAVCAFNRETLRARARFAAALADPAGGRPCYR